MGSGGPGNELLERNWNEVDSQIHLFRQRDKFRFLRDPGKAPSLPIPLGLFDPFFSTGNQIPPDRSLPQWFSTNDHQPSRFNRHQLNDGRRIKYGHLVLLQVSAIRLQLSVNNISRPLPDMIRECNSTVLLQPHLNIQGR